MSEPEESAETGAVAVIPPHIPVLPFDVIVHIVEQSDQSEWGNLAEVNNQFRHAVRLCLQPLTSISLSQFLKPLVGLASEEVVVFMLQTLVDLESLTIHASVLPVIRNHVGAQLCALKNLKSLDIGGCFIREKLLCRILRGLPQLEELRLRGCLFTKGRTDYDESKCSPQALRELNDDTYHSLKTIGKRVIKRIATLKNLKKLDIYECYSGRDTLSILLSELPDLREIYIQFP
uniref:F-box domain-containing protein n=1 Tax=Trichuris muris TaxID=70415 RepID=A0A5S6QBB4_TRIMR